MIVSYYVSSHKVVSLRDTSSIDWMKWKHRVGVKSINHQGVTNRQMSLSNEETCQSKQIAQQMVTDWTVP